MRSERRIELSGKVKNVLVVDRQGGLHRVALGDECERRLVEELREFDRTFFGVCLSETITAAAIVVSGRRLQ